MSIIAPDDLLTRTYLTEPDETGQRFRAKILEKIISLQEGLEQHPDRIKFLVRFEGTDCLDELVAYNQVLVALESDLLDPDEHMWSFKDSIAHEGPLTQDSPSYIGSSYNILIAWEDGLRNFEPLKSIAADNPAVCAVYAERAKLLDTDGWKQLRRLVKRNKLLDRQLNQAKLSSYQSSPLFKFGYQGPRNHKEGLTLDEKNGNTKYRDAEKLEMSQHAEYSTFKSLGKGSPGPDGYKKIRVHFGYDVKHDGCHKASLLAGGHLTNVPVDSVYSELSRYKTFVSVSSLQN
jgi:hypothetical protein